MEVTILLISLNAAVSILGLYRFPQLIRTLMLMPQRVISRHTWYEVITSGFVHAGLVHLLFNMITLYFFGPVIEGVLGHSQFLILYMSGLVVSSLPSLIMHRNGPKYATLGASGAVESVLFAFILIFPFDKIYLMFIPVGIPAVIFGVLFIAYSIYAGRKEGRINHEAHIAGALWGILYMLLFVPRTLEHVLNQFGF